MSDSKKRSEAAKKASATRRRNAAAAAPTLKVHKSGKMSEAARKAWETRRADEEKAEAERQEALRILDEMEKAHQEQQRRENNGTGN